MQTAALDSPKKVAGWLRVSKREPCQICGKPDWCGFTSDGRVGCCMRVESDRPMRNGGWLHKLTDVLPVYAFGWTTPAPRKPSEPPADITLLWQHWSVQTDSQAINRFAVKLGVRDSALESLEPVWADAHRAWAFPMRDERDRMIGIRLRNDQGRKWAVRGSRQGLFIPIVEPQETLLICEGPTDTAAALTLGFYAIGRPSCSGQESMITAFIRRSQVRRVIIVADPDQVGLDGANKLKAMIRVPCCIFIPPSKDMREFVLAGGDARVVKALVAGLRWA